jgi:putative exporter of polyketide antibiotics
MTEGDTLLNAAIGAVVSVVGAPLLPVAAVFGGLVAGYLQGGDEGEGAKVGALSGVIATVPVVFILALALLFLPFVPIEVAAVGVFLLGVLVFVSAAYLVGAGAVGGVIGAYLHGEL